MKQRSITLVYVALSVAFVVFPLLHISYADEDQVQFKHNNEVAFVLDGAGDAHITVKPAGLVFNDILEYSLQVSNQFPWDDGEREALGTSLAGASFDLGGEVNGAAFDSPWPDSWDLWDELSDRDVDLLLGMLGYGRYKIDINGLVFYLNTTDGRWNWAYFRQSPTAGDIQFWIRENGIFIDTKHEVGAI